MEVVDRLAAVLPAVEHEPVAGGDPELSCYLGRHDNEVSYEGCIFRLERGDVDNSALGNDEEVNG